MTVSPNMRILVIGYGNPGRLDDGLGTALAERLQEMGIAGVTVDADYQLSVEHAEAVSRHDAVVFADAHVDCAEPFTFTRIQPDGRMNFTTHALTPEGVMGLAGGLFAATATGYLIAIRGYEFDRFGQGLSDRAAVNLEAALDFLRSALQRGRLDEVPRPAQQSSVVREAACHEE